MMDVTVKLYASLAHHLPDGASKNSAQITVAEEATVQTVIDQLRLPTEACHLVLLNGVFQPPAARASAHMSGSDVLAIWPPVAGG